MEKHSSRSEYNVRTHWRRP